MLDSLAIGWGVMQQILTQRVSLVLAAMLWYSMRGYAGVPLDSPLQGGAKLKRISNRNHKLAIFGGQPTDSDVYSSDGHPDMHAIHLQLTQTH